MNKFARRVDRDADGLSLQIEIKQAVFAAGWDWRDTFTLGGGFPDGIAAVEWLNVLVEIKRAGEMLNANEKKFWNSWRGLKIIAFNGQDAVNKLSTLRREYGDGRRGKR